MKQKKSRRKRLFAASIFSKFLFFGSFLVAPIYETQHIADIRNYTTKDKKHTLLLFDIDNTLLEANEIKARPAYFHTLMQQFKDAEDDHLTAIGKAVKIARPALARATVHPVENNTAKVVQTLQAEGFKTMALTARGIVNPTIKQLTSIGIDFSKTKIGTNLPYLIKASNFVENAFYKAGIIFCLANEKGSVLEKVLALAKFRPKRIIFIDDKLSDLQSVQLMAQRLNIEFIGLRYGYLDFAHEATALKSQRKQSAH